MIMRSNIKKILNSLLFLGFVVVIGWLPQVVDSDLMYPTVSGKTVFFLFGMSFLLAIQALRVLVSGAVFYLNLTDLALALLLGYIAINRYWIQDVHGFSLRWLELLALGIFYVLLRAQRTEFYPWLLLAFMFSGFGQAVYGFLQLFDYYPSNHTGFRLTGSFFNPGPYAGFLAGAWAVTFAIYLYRKSFVRLLLGRYSQFQGPHYRFFEFSMEYIPFFSILLMGSVVLLSRSRAAILAVVLCGGALALYRHRGRLQRRFQSTTPWRRVALAGALALILVGGLWGAYCFKQGSADGRWLIWKVTTHMVADAPLFGRGFDRFRARYMDYQADYFQGKEDVLEAYLADNVRYAFNAPLQFVAEEGLTGLLLVVVLLYVLLGRKRIRSPLTLFGGMILLAVFVFGLFAYPEQILSTKVAVVMALAIMTDKVSKVRLGYAFWPVFARALTVSGALMLGAVLVWKGNSVQEAFRTWKTADWDYRYGDFQMAAEDFQSCEKVLGSDGAFLLQYGKALAMCERWEEALATLQKAVALEGSTVAQTSLGDCYKALDRTAEAKEAYKKALAMVPSRFFPCYLLAKLYAEKGKRKEAGRWARELMRKPVRVPSTAIEEMREEMRKIISENALGEGKPPGTETKI
ncbi:hypothetical protein FUAX_29370 [Fulvitalea axinellae]|uniref:O-antigen ligase-related domain-containing protein n=2 Tax=Fulvitalea axinellae TaxID=1182444 RepID=A0AAU9CMD5_9BACT|nr:hypothetical protein FUAX_29370 [Fulvitalea axinellae]